MRLLLSNDDGCFAPGLNTLYDTLSQRFADTVVVAPDRNHSGASSALTLTRPIRVREQHDNFYCADGTPTDCVHMAVTGMLDQHPDMVISGINEGPNLGDDVLYSGTVAAATEGRSLGYPALAISLASHEAIHYETAAKVALYIIEKIQRQPLDSVTILNINVPDLPWEQLQGFATTRLGNRHNAEQVVATKDPRGRPIYWIGRAGKQADAGPGTDFYAIENNQVSITPLHIDRTRHSVLESLSQWVGTL